MEAGAATRSDPIDIERREVSFRGSAYDINRVMQACSATLKAIEFNRADPLDKRTVTVPAPLHDEP